jgi:Bacterial Ig-like domain
MANLSRWVFAAVTTTLVASACTVPDTTTGLHPEGPPFIQQLFLSELDVTRNEIIAFGWHKDIANGRTDETTDLTHPTTSAAVGNQSFRMVFDELLIGNTLEEIACRTGEYSRVPEGATPDDIANCSVTDDLLVKFCKGPHAVCLDAGGVPRGVLDEDENGSADDTQMIDGALKLTCGAINVPINRALTFWQPAGNQLVPAKQLPKNSLGPALIIETVNRTLPSSSDCTFAFAPDVADKDHLAPCAPTGGTIATEPDDQDVGSGTALGNCTPGDLSAMAFASEDISLDSTSPSNNATNIAITRRNYSFILTAKPDPASLPGATVTVMQGAGTRTDFTVALNAANAARIDLLFGADLLPNTMYTISLGNLRDAYGIAITGPFTLHFTTAP